MFSCLVFPAMLVIDKKDWPGYEESTMVFPVCFLILILILKEYRSSRLWSWQAMIFSAHHTVQCSLHLMCWAIPDSDGRWNYWFNDGGVELNQQCLRQPKFLKLPWKYKCCWAFFIAAVPVANLSHFRSCCMIVSRNLQSSEDYGRKYR